MSGTPAAPCISKFRKAFKRFLFLKFAYWIDKGDFDQRIDCFLNGDTLTVSFDVSFIPNDVIFMRTLAGLQCPPDVIKKIHAAWDAEREREAKCR